ncbi:hypothetical protein QVD17_07835 [Tagetes erecta]|uniref:non-specific serine/threonine protein kinase n=1 Tax=Tagetes erecta TaxID=13708 RepID=A0AAD8L1L8_TARER|nr:hypothetical protein QVD17_07835 [Tagetes erecta]
MFRGGPWNGITFTGISTLKPNPIYNFTFVLNQRETYYQYTIEDTSLITRKKLPQQVTSENKFGHDPENKSCDEDMELPLFGLSAIFTATYNFSRNNKLGEGGFGPVYKGILEDGKEVVVKRLSKKSSQGLREFKNEVISISRLQHHNLVTLLGCCIEGDEKMLIYEYMSNKGLDRFLFGK